MKRTAHHVGGGHGIPEDGREGMADALVEFLDALACVSEKGELLNHSRSIDFFGKQYDDAVEFASRELGFEIRIAAGSE